MRLSFAHAHSHSKSYHHSKPNRDFAHLIAAAVVGFVEQFITVIEGDLQAVLEVAILSGSLQRDLVLNLTLNDGSAFRTYNYVVLLLHNESAANLRDIVLGFQNNVQ